MTRWPIEPRRFLREGDDRALALVFAAATAIGIATTSHLRGGLAANLLVNTLFCMPIAWRRRAPAPALLALLSVGVLASAFLSGLPHQMVEVVAVALMCYSAGAHTELRTALAALAFALAGATAVSVLHNSSAADFLFPDLVFITLPWLAGRAVRNQQMLNRTLDEKAARIERERADRAEREVARERVRIARELHDVLAHSVSVMVIQAAAGGRIVADDPDRAAEAARLIHRTGREALIEMRRVCGVLHRDERELGGDARPSIARVGALAARARAAGLGVEVRVEGRPVNVPVGVDAAAYRIVQEGLTNALKHAGPARAHVLVRYLPEALDIEVADDGCGRPADEAFASGGNGLIGMRERVGVYGGSLEAGRRHGGGFRVRASLPLTAAEA